MPRPFLLLAVALAISVPPIVAVEPITITVYPDEPIGELRAIWNYFGTDEALTVLTPEGQHLLGELRALPGELVSDLLADPARCARQQHDIVFE